MLFIYVDYSLRHHRILPCSILMTYATEKQNMQIATLRLTATAYWTSLCCCLLFEKYHIASIPNAEILQNKRAPYLCFRRAPYTVTFVCVVCTLGYAFAKMKKVEGKSLHTHTHTHAHTHIHLPSSIRFSESLRTEKINGSVKASRGWFSRKIH